MYEIDTVWVLFVKPILASGSTEWENLSKQFGVWALKVIEIFYLLSISIDSERSNSKNSKRSLKDKTSENYVWSDVERFKKRGWCCVSFSV